MEEHELVRRAKRGDARAFSELIRMHERSMYATAYGILRSQWDAADAVQDAFAEAYAHVGTLRDTKRFKAWLSRILVNKCNDIYRRKRGTIATAEPPEPRDAFEYLGRDEGLDLMAAVQKLDDDHRQVITLRYFRDMKVDEIAEVLGCPSGTVKSRLNRAISRLGMALGVEKAQGGRSVRYMEVAE